MKDEMKNKKKKNKNEKEVEKGGVVSGRKDTIGDGLLLSGRTRPLVRNLRCSLQPQFFSPKATSL